MNLVLRTFKLALILTSLLGSSCGNYFSEDDIPELGYLDTSVDPCDNFYDFACGNFGKIHPLPPDANIVDHFTLLEDDLVKIGHEILSSAKLEDDPIAVKKAKSAYKACVNTNTYNNDFSPEIRTVKEFGGMPLLSNSNATTEFFWNDLGDLVGRYRVPLLFIYSVGQTSQNESVIRMSSDPFSNPSLFRPKLGKSYDEVLEESLQEHAKSRSTRSTAPAPFDIFLRTLARNLLKYTNPLKTDEEVIDDLNDMATFMRQMYAGGIVDGDIIPLESEITVETLQEWTDKQFSFEVELNWIDYLNRVFQMTGLEITKNVKILQQNTQWLYGVLNLVKQTDPKVLKNFALLRVFLFQAPDSNYATRKAFEDYYQAKGYQLFPRWEYCTRKILDVVDTASLSYAVTYSFGRYHYNINKISDAAEMVNIIRNSFEEILSSTEWMDVQSRDAALQKARNMLILLGYPDIVDNEDDLEKFYENFRVCEWDNYGNARNIRAFRQAYQFTQIIPNRLFWGKSTFDPNAYYNRPNNKIVIPISMLNPTFFYGNNPILDYSRLGSIIGHEITHGFDINGKNYDQDGMLQSFWTSQTTNSFIEKANCFIDQYNEYYVPQIDTYVNGTLSINENLADNGGIRESYKAFKEIVEKKNISAIGQYSLEQLFFIGYATMWCTEESDYTLSILVSSPNSYPPKRYRVIGSLSNMEEFSSAFNCPSGSYMNPETKCSLW